VFISRSIAVTALALVLMGGCGSGGGQARDGGTDVRTSHASDASDARHDLGAPGDSGRLDAASADAGRADAAVDGPVDGPRDAPGQMIDAGADSGVSAAGVCGTLIDLGTLPGDVSSAATAVNDLGQVVGTSSSAADSSGTVIRSAFLWQSGTMTLVPTGSVWTGAESIAPNPQPDAINHAGVIVGSQAQAFIYLSTAPAVWKSQSSGAQQMKYPGYGYGNATAINEAGQVIGTAQVCTDTTVCIGHPTRVHAFFWQDWSGTGVDVGTLGGVNTTPAQGFQVDWSLETSLAALNQAGQAVGWSLTPAGKQHAVLWSNDTLLDLGTLGGDTSIAYAIDETGAVFGTSTTADGQTHVFLWAMGSMTDLGALPTESVGVTAINRVGEVIGRMNVGSYFWKAGETTVLPMGGRALNDFGEVAGADGSGLVVWQHGVTTDLGNLGGSQGITPVSIDNAGRIVGSGPSGAGNMVHGFLFQPAACQN
jgi:probable HAF family extracellular repeat protein